MKNTITLLFVLFSFASYGQQKKLDAILKEGQLLFRLEKAAWYGSDDFQERFKHLISDFGGYVSYETKDHFINTVYFSRKNPNKILARYQFDSIPKKQVRYVDTFNRDARKNEKILIDLRIKTIQAIASKTDPFYSFYKKSSPNIIPVIQGKERKVYILTGTQESGVLLLGNDYLLTFNGRNKLIKKKKLHNSLIRIELKSKGSEIVSTIHSHVVNPLVDVTDICTILLYKDFSSCKTHFVISKKLVTIFDIEKQKLFSMTRKAWERMYKNDKPKK